MSYNIRHAQTADAARLLEIYTPYVLDTVVSFEYEPPSQQEFVQRMENISAKYPWLVCEYDGVIIGYAYASDFRYRAAYQWSPESTIYLAPEAQGKGIGGILYEVLMSVLRLQGFYNVFAGLALPNEKSERIHLAKGFREIGVFENIGYKHGAWHTTKWFQLVLAAHPALPQHPQKIEVVRESAGYLELLAAANDRLNK